MTFAARVILAAYGKAARDAKDGKPSRQTTGTLAGGKGAAGRGESTGHSLKYDQR